MDAHIKKVYVPMTEKDGLIHFIREEDKRKIYEITELGTEVLELELKRIRRLYRNAQEVTK